MKNFRIFYLLVTLSAFAAGCSKSDDEPGCDENETTKVTFSNTGSSSLRVEMATQFDAQYNPISPVFTFDLAPGTTSVREFRYGTTLFNGKQIAIPPARNSHFMQGILQYARNTRKLNRTGNIKLINILPII